MRKRTLLTIENLENRWCPTVTATLKSGLLTVSGTAVNGSISIVQDSVTAGKFQVFDGVTPVSGSPFTGAKSVRINLTSAADNVNVDLGGKTLSGTITANLGAGANNFSLINGGATRLALTSLDGDDTVTLGNAADNLTLGSAALNVDGGIDTVHITDKVSITGGFTSYYANNVSLDAGSKIGCAYLRGGSGGNDIDVSGTVTGYLYINCLYAFSGSSDAALINVSGEVDGYTYVAGTNLDDTITLTGNFGSWVRAYGLSGADDISVAGTVTSYLYVDAGSGDDSIALNGVVGGSSVVYGGAGNDSAVIGASAQLMGNSVVSMGAGNDTVNLSNAATTNTLLINGGSGTDTFIGNKVKAGLSVVSFEL